MTITVSAIDVIRIVLLVMLFSIAAATYVQGWRLFFSRSNKLDSCDRVMGTGILWGVSLACIGATWAIVARIPLI